MRAESLFCQLQYQAYIIDPPRQPPRTVQYPRHGSIGKMAETDSSSSLNGDASSSPTPTPTSVSLASIAENFQRSAIESARTVQHTSSTHFRTFQVSSLFPSPYVTVLWLLPSPYFTGLCIFFALQATQIRQLRFSHMLNFVVNRLES